MVQGQRINTTGLKLNTNVQVWMKKQPSNAVAVLILNAGPTDVNGVVVPLSALGLSGAHNGRSIWEHKDTGSVAGSINVGTLKSHDSTFMLLTPAHVP